VVNAGRRAAAGSAKECNVAEYVPRYSKKVRRLALLFVPLLVVMGCSRNQARQYPLKGQIIAIGASQAFPGRVELTVRHDDIPGFMPAMTMGYFLKEGTRAEGLAAGDLFTATLVVNGGELYVQDVHKTGHAAVPAEARPVRIMDVMGPGDLMPDDPLVDQTGASRRLTDWKGRALAVTFVYTRCPVPDFCPLMDRHFADLQRAILADASLRDRVHLVSISFDPKHDTPAAIKAHANERGADPRVWSYLTGDAAAIDHVTSRFGVSTIEEHDAPESITHNLRTAVIDAKGRLVTIYNGNAWTVDGLLHDLRAQVR
jgi:protein SCO1/2